MRGRGEGSQGHRRLFYQPVKDPPRHAVIYDLFFTPIVSAGPVFGGVEPLVCEFAQRKEVPLL